MKVAAPETTGAERRQGLGGEAGRAASAQTQEVALEQEAGDLASSVGQQAIQLHRPVHDVEDIGVRVALVEQGLAGLGRDAFAGAGHALKFMALQVRADAQRAGAAGGARMDVFQTHLFDFGLGRSGVHERRLPDSAAV